MTPELYLWPKTSDTLHLPTHWTPPLGHHMVLQTISTFPEPTPVPGVPTSGNGPPIHPAAQARSPFLPTPSPIPANSPRALTALLQSLPNPPAGPTPQQLPVLRSSPSFALIAIWPHFFLSP